VVAHALLLARATARTRQRHFALPAHHSMRRCRQAPPRCPVLKGTTYRDAGMPPRRAPLAVVSTRDTALYVLDVELRRAACCYTGGIHAYLPHPRGGGDADARRASRPRLIRAAHHQRRGRADSTTTRSLRCKRMAAHPAAAPGAPHGLRTTLRLPPSRRLLRRTTVAPDCFPLRYAALTL